MRHTYSPKYRNNVSHRIPPFAASFLFRYPQNPSNPFFLVSFLIAVLSFTVIGHPMDEPVRYYGVPNLLVEGQHPARHRLTIEPDVEALGDEVVVEPPDEGLVVASSVGEEDRGHRYDGFWCRVNFNPPIFMSLLSSRARALLRAPVSAHHLRSRTLTAPRQSDRGGCQDRHQESPVHPGSTPEIVPDQRGELHGNPSSLMITARGSTVLPREDPPTSTGLTDLCWWLSALAAAWGVATVNPALIFSAWRGRMGRRFLARARFLDETGGNRC